MLNLVLIQGKTFKNKYILILALIVILLFFIIGLIYLVMRPSSLVKRSNNILNYVEQQKYEEYIPKDRMEKALKTISSPSSTADQKYQALNSISFYLQDAYYKSNNPKIRKLLESLNSKAQKNFPDQFAEDDFLVACADPECGEKPDAEAEKILVDIQNLKVDKLYTNIISTNLKNALYVPYDTSSHKLDKLSLFNLAYSQLLELNNNEASKSAESLRNYVKNKYNRDITDLKSLTKGL